MRIQISGVARIRTTAAPAFKTSQTACGEVVMNSHVC
jgi:hypothetical protein